MPVHSPFEMASARFFATAGAPVIWTRNSGGYNNIVVMNDEVIAVSTLPGSQLDAARDRLEAGASIDEVLGTAGTRIRIQAVDAVTACLNNTDVEVLYDKGGRRLTTCRFPAASAEAQADMLVEARDRMRGETATVESQANRVWHAMKPFNLLVVFAVLSMCAQNYFTTDVFDGEANRQRLESWGENVENKDIHATRARQRGMVRTISRNPGLQKILVFGIIIIGVVCVVLNTLGYAATMTILLSGTGATLIWTLSRLGNPPRTLSVVAQRG